MNTEQLTSYASRLFFAIAVILLLFAVLESVLFRTGGPVHFWVGYEPGRLIEFGAMFLLPVITVLLRQIRQELRKQK